MFSAEHSFLFTCRDSKQPTTARKVHIRRLYDVLQLCLQRGDFLRAKRAWAILSRCKGINWKTMWKLGVQLSGEQAQYDMERNEQKIKFLGATMRQHPDEVVLSRSSLNTHKRALDELDLYLPSFPYQDNPVLHVYAGLISLYLAQPPANLTHDDGHADELGWNASLLRDARSHLERAKLLDPDNVVAETFLDKLPILSQPRQDRKTPGSDDESMDVDETGQRHKRAKTQLLH
ncbi:hypothetical protein AcV7_008179 [Taiwanofungus camphoratus]|nr:hypothetical protein AcV7_008179 [Antrodia cinnamomea]